MVIDFFTAVHAFSRTPWLEAGNLFYTIHHWQAGLNCQKSCELPPSPVQPPRLAERCFEMYEFISQQNIDQLLSYKREMSEA